jgi:hypothetical protein
VTYIGCAPANASIRKRTVLSLLEQSTGAKSAVFGTGKTVSYLVCNDYGYIFGAGEVTEELS